MNTETDITYTVETVFEGNESNPFENPAKSLYAAESLFLNFTMYPDPKLVSVALVRIGTEAETLKTWKRS